MKDSRSRFIATIVLAAAIGSIGAFALDTFSQDDGGTGLSFPENLPLRYTIVDTDLGNFLLDTSTGDTWKWFYNAEAGPQEDSMGWQYFDKPLRIHTATMNTMR